MIKYVLNTSKHILSFINYNIKLKSVLLDQMRVPCLYKINKDIPALSW